MELYTRIINILRDVPVIVNIILANTKTFFINTLIDSLNEAT